jgi:hypothetical protein
MSQADAAAQALAATAPSHAREKLLAVIAESLRQSHPGTVVAIEDRLAASLPPSRTRKVNHEYRSTT